MVKLPNDERVVVVLLGESGSGKSNLLNLILNTPGEQNVVFLEGEGAEPCTVQPQEENGCWRGDPARQITVFDTPGLGAGDAPGSDASNLNQVLHLVKDLSYVSCFLLVVRSGLSRFLSQHQKMFESIEAAFGPKFWSNVIFDLSCECSGRDKRNFERWLSKLQERFPASLQACIKQVYINTPNHRLDTLEELWDMINQMERYRFNPAGPVAVKVELDQGRESPDLSTSSNISIGSEISSTLSRSLSDLRSQRSVLRSSLSNLTGSRTDLYSARSDLLDLPGMPPLPPRSPTISRRRCYQPPRSVTSTPRLPRSYMPTLSSLEDFSTSRYSTPRIGRRSFRDTSPLSSYSCRSSRETSPSVSGFKTVGIPTYLRTCTAYKHPFTKAMREGRLALSYASEERILLDKADDLPYPQLQNIDTIIRVPAGEDLVHVAHQSFVFLDRPPVLLDIQPLLTVNSQATSSWETSTLHCIAGWDLESFLEETVGALVEGQVSEASSATRSTVKEDTSHLHQPGVLSVKNPFLYVRRALLPKVKYHWDKGFHQGKTGVWEKVPVIKIKVKYSEEDKEVLPFYVSIEGGRWCESRRVKMEGHKGKCKLRASEGPEFSVRVIPLDRELRPDVSIPEFLFAIFPAEESGEAEKWMKAEVRPSLPE